MQGGGEELSIDELGSNLSTYKEQLQQVRYFSNSSLVIFKLGGINFGYLWAVISSSEEASWFLHLDQGFYGLIGAF